MMETDLFDFAYVPDWYGQLDELSMRIPLYWSGTYTLFSENRALILIQKGMPGKRRVIFMWRMRVPVSIQDYTHPDTKGFMPALTGTTKGLQ